MRAPRSTSWWVGLPALLVVTLGLPGCSRVQPAADGERCSEDQPCAKGLRCSFKAKRCYRPVDCDALAKRLETCTRELLEAFSPAAQKLPSGERAKLLPRVREHLRTEVVTHCRFDAAEHKRKLGTKPPKSKSRGEDAEAETLNGCLGKGPCDEFAKCFLGVSGLRSDRRKDPSYRAVFPVALPRPAATTPGADVSPQGTRPPHEGEDMADPTPARDAPDKDAPARDVPARDVPARDVPARDAPARDAPARGAPARGAPARGAPARGAPARGAPARMAAPAERPPPQP